MFAVRLFAIAWGSILVVAGFIVPWLIEGKRDHGGGMFTPGTQSLEKALASLTTALMPAFSIMAAVVLVLVGLSLNQTATTVSVWLGVGTFALFGLGAAMSLYESLLRPLSGTAPRRWFVLLLFGLFLVGLGLTMLTLAFLIDP